MNHVSKIQPRRVTLGRDVITTRSADAHLTMHEMDEALLRHQAGDWGLIGDADAKRNERHLRSGKDVLSVFRNGRGDEFAVSTDPAQDTTFIMGPDDHSSHKPKAA